MNKFLLFFLLIIFLCGKAYSQKDKNKKLIFRPIRYKFESYENAQVKLSDKEIVLYNLIMEYRNSFGLPLIPLSKALTFVAQTHSGDLTENYKVKKRCTLNSWSKKGTWTACCYKKDHSLAACMWNKPRELTTYEGDGYELVYWNLWTPTPETTLDRWKNNPNNNMVLLNTDEWKEISWKAIGIGMYGDFAVVWLGKIPDRDGEPIQPDKN